MTTKTKPEKYQGWKSIAEEAMKSRDQWMTRAHVAETQLALEQDKLRWASAVIEDLEAQIAAKPIKRTYSKGGHTHD